jgi:hypothetical protein
LRIKLKLLLISQVWLTAQETSPEELEKTKWVTQISYHTAVEYLKLLLSSPKSFTSLTRTYLFPKTSRNT